MTLMPPSIQPAQLPTLPVYAMRKPWSEPRHEKLRGVEDPLMHGSS
jgi:hypothetical protein